VFCPSLKFRMRESMPYFKLWAPRELDMPHGIAQTCEAGTE